jgi:hypothetical protein
LTSPEIAAKAVVFPATSCPDRIEVDELVVGVWDVLAADPGAAGPGEVLLVGTAATTGVAAGVEAAARAVIGAAVIIGVATVTGFGVATEVGLGVEITVGFGVGTSVGLGVGSGVGVGVGVVQGVALLQAFAFGTKKAFSSWVSNMTASLAARLELPVDADRLPTGTTGPCSDRWL